MPDIKIIALDLDGTLLNSNKELSAENYRALEEAAAQGIEIVPTTGRFYDAMPQVIRDLPFVNYVITINGAEIYDKRRNCSVSQAEIPLAQALQIMEFLDTLPVIYDCFMGGAAWMTQRLYEQSAEFAPNIHYKKMLLELRQPVPELKAFIKERGHDIQKIQFFTKDMELRERMLHQLQDIFPETAVSTSVVNNVEINNCHANKGEAIHTLARYLGVDPACTMAFGDALNDLQMIQAAGFGVAMENGHPLVKEKADFVTRSCDEDGVAFGIRKFCLK